MKDPNFFYRLLCACALLFIATPSMAQNDSTESTDAKQNRMQFGFIVGLNSPQYTIHSTSAVLIGTTTRPGFSVGVGGEYNVSERFSLGLQFLLAHNRSSMHLDFHDSLVISLRPLQAALDCKVQARYKLSESSKHSPYLLAGGGLRKAMTEGHLIYDWNGTNLLQTAEIGVGWQVKSKHFFCNPELVFSHGLNSLGQGYAIESVDWNSITLLIYLKG